MVGEFVSNHLSCNRMLFMQVVDIFYVGGEIFIIVIDTNKRIYICC